VPQARRHQQRHAIVKLRREPHVVEDDAAVVADLGPHDKALQGGDWGGRGVRRLDARDEVAALGIAEDSRDRPDQLLRLIQTTNIYQRRELLRR
jgi:hypothetical protein